MRRSQLGVFLLGLSIAVGCSKDQESPPADGGAVSQPASAAASAPAQMLQRAYEAIPANLFEEPQTPAPTARSEWSLVQVALAEGSWDKAVQAYERIKAGFPDEDRLLAVTSLQLSDALMSTTPPDVPRARAVLDDAPSRIERCSSNKAFRAAFDVLSLSVYLAEGGKEVSGGEGGFEKWLDVLGQQAGRCDMSHPDIRPISHAIDHLIGSVDLRKKDVVDRIGRMLDVLQAKAWSCSDLLRALQDRRIQVLVEAGRTNEALLAARVLLALSSQDAQAWIGAIDRVALVMTTAGRGEEEIKRFKEFQRYGVDGPDGRVETPDDLADPLAVAAGGAVARSGEIRGGAMSTTQPVSEIETSVRSAVVLLTNGEGEKAIERLTKSVHSASVMSDRDISLVMDYLAAAYALRDGHTLYCGRYLCQLVAAADGAGVSPVWRDAVGRFLNHREVVIRGLVDGGQSELALGTCRAIANEELPVERCHLAVDMAWEACRASVKGGTNQSVLPIFREFGKTLSRPEARIYRARLVAQKCKEFGDEAAVLAEIEGLRDIWDEVLQDPQLVLLHASCLVRQGRSADALGEVEQLCERSDPSPEWVHRAQLLLGVIYIQEGQPAEARRILRRMLDEEPDRECRGRAITILRKIQM